MYLSVFKTRGTYYFISVSIYIFVQRRGTRKLYERREEWEVRGGEAIWSDWHEQGFLLKYRVFSSNQHKNFIDKIFIKAACLLRLTQSKVIFKSTVLSFSATNGVLSKLESIFLTLCYLLKWKYYSADCQYRDMRCGLT